MTHLYSQSGYEKNWWWYGLCLDVDTALWFIMNGKAYLYNRIYSCSFTQVTAQVWITVEEKSGKS